MRTSDAAAISTLPRRGTRLSASSLDLLHARFRAHARSGLVLTLARRRYDGRCLDLGRLELLDLAAWRSCCGAGHAVPGAVEPVRRRGDSSNALGVAEACSAPERRGEIR